jgi:hypothetical protein
MKHIPKDRIVVSTNCGMAPMRPEVAWRKLAALGQGAAARAATLRLTPSRAPWLKGPQPEPA